MSVERTSGTSSLVDVLDRVLDKGIVIDAWVRVSLVGIELLTVEARVVVASIATYLGYSDALSSSGKRGRRRRETPSPPWGKVFLRELRIGGPAIFVVALARS